MGIFCDEGSTVKLTAAQMSERILPLPSEEGSNHRDREVKRSLQWDYFLHVLKQGFRSVTEAGGDPIAIPPRRNYINSPYERKKKLHYKLCSEYLITTKVCTVDSIVESAVLSMKVISHTTQGMQVS